MERENVKPELILAYLDKNKLPEISEYKIGNLPREGWAIEYKNAEIVHVRSETGLEGLLLNEDNPPIAISYLGTSKDPRK